MKKPKRIKSIEEIRADFQKTFQRISDKHNTSISFSVGDGPVIRRFEPKKKKP